MAAHDARSACSASTTASAGTIGGRNSGQPWSIHARTSTPSRHSSATGVGPMFRPKTQRCWPARIMSAWASANVLPMVGWPAIGTSRPGVKIRIRTSVPVASAGIRNVLSEKFISAASLCIVAVSRSRASGNTASWLPSKGRSVKTS